MAEANADVNQIRREIRDSLGVDTIEVRQSLDTALQIRRRLADNRIVAMLMDRHSAAIACGDTARPAGVVPADAALMAYSDRRAAAAVLHRAARPGPLQAVPGDPIFVAAIVPRDEAIAGRGAAVRRSARASASAGIPSSGITSTATGTRSATPTTGSPDGADGPGLARGARPHARRLGTGARRSAAPLPPPSSAHWRRTSTSW